MCTSEESSTITLLNKCRIKLPSKYLLLHTYISAYFFFKDIYLYISIYIWREITTFVRKEFSLQFTLFKPPNIIFDNLNNYSSLLIWCNVKHILKFFLWYQWYLNAASFNLYYKSRGMKHAIHEVINSPYQWHSSFI